VGKLLFQRFLAVQVALSNGKRALLVNKLLYYQNRAIRRVFGAAGARFGDFPN